MANTQRTIPEILQVAKVSQYLAANDVATKTFMKGGALDMSISRMIYIERKSVQNLYDLDPTNSTLRDTANYLWAILGKYAIQAQNILANLDQAPPVVTGANNQSVQDGATATFTIGVTSTLPYTIAWYKNGVLIPGETGTSYSFTASLSDDGNTYYAIATSSAGSTQSQTGTLSVTQTITGSYFFGDVDYYPELSVGIDNINYNGTFNIINGDSLVVNFTSGAQNNKFNGIRYPLSQGSKTAWFNTLANSGSVPDSTYRAVITIGSYLYIISRNAMSLDGTTSVVTFS